MSESSAAIIIAPSQIPEMFRFHAQVTIAGASSRRSHRSDQGKKTDQDIAAIAIRKFRRKLYSGLWPRPFDPSITTLLNLTYLKADRTFSMDCLHRGCCQ